jgi:hypothetical protein
MKKVHTQSYPHAINLTPSTFVAIGLIQVLEYCEHHRGEPLPTNDDTQDETRKRTTDISEWDQKFIAVDQEMLFEIILAANYLDIKALLCVTVLALANCTLLSKSRLNVGMLDARPLQI